MFIVVNNVNADIQLQKRPARKQIKTTSGKAWSRIQESIFVDIVDFPFEAPK